MTQNAPPVARTATRPFRRLSPLRLLNVPAGTEASNASRAQLQSLDLGRFGEGALIRAATLVNQAMHNQFLRLTAEVK